MFKNFKDWLNLRINLFIENISIKLTSYKRLWEQQNMEIDLMRCSHNKEVKNLKKSLEEKDLIIDNKNIHIEQLKDEKTKIKKDYQKYQQKTKEQYLDLMNKYQDSTLKVQDLITSKRKLSSSKGGLNTKVRYQKQKINQLENENVKVKKLLQQVIKENGRKLAPPTIQELRNYDLYGNKKGKRK